MNIRKLVQLKEKFDFVFEWGLLHHIIPKQRKKYVKDVSFILNNNGKYLSVSLNEQSPEYGGHGKKIRESQLGTKIYYASHDELTKLFNPYFRIIEAKTVTLLSRIGSKHIGNYFFMEKL